MTDTVPAAEAEYVELPRRESMLKLVYLLRRRPELSRAQFQEHWLERHSHFGRENPAVRRLVQYHALENDPVRASLAQAADAPDTDGYDGAAMVWFDSIGAMQQMMKTEAVAAALEDERHFIDHSRSVAILTDENVIVEPSGDAPIVLIECITKQPSMSRAAFSERWLHHGFLGREANRRGLLQGYIQAHAIDQDDARVAELQDLTSSEESWDGVVAAYFHSLAVAIDLFQSSLASDDAYEDEKEFMDHSKIFHMMTRRHVIKDLVR